MNEPVTETNNGATRYNELALRTYVDEEPATQWKDMNAQGRTRALRDYELDLMAKHQQKISLSGDRNSEAQPPISRMKDEPKSVTGGGNAPRKLSDKEYDQRRREQEQGNYDGRFEAGEGNAPRLSKKELTKAVTAYARRHNHYVSFVRANTTALREAIKEYHNGAFINGKLFKPLDEGEGDAPRDKYSLGPDCDSSCLDQGVRVCGHEFSIKHHYGQCPMCGGDHHEAWCPVNNEA